MLWLFLSTVGSMGAFPIMYMYVQCIFISHHLVPLPPQYMFAVHIIHNYVLKARVYTYKRGSCSSELAHGVRAYLLLGLCVGIHTQFVGIHGVRAYGV